MGRMIPLDGDPLIHPALPFSLLLAAMAATIAIITGLCGFRRKRKRSPDLSAPDLADKSSDLQTALETPQQAILETDEKITENSEQVIIKDLPPPPGMMMRALKETSSHSCKNFMTKSESTRKLSLTLSVKHVKSISVKIGDQKKRSKDEDSIWKKTIILGEKCKISDDDDDAVIFDGKGNTVSVYHPRTLSTISISRTSSFKEPHTSTISRTKSFREEPDTILNQNKEKGIITRKEEEDS